MSTNLKRLFGILIVGVALSLGILTALPMMAEAQDMDEAAMDVEQNTLKNTGAVVATQPTTQPPAASRQVVNYGDSLWSIAQKHLGPEATPEQVLEEARRIYEINRDWIGDDPNLILVGQELLMPSVAKSAAQPIAQEIAQEPLAAEPAPAESAAPAKSVALPDPPEAQEQDTPVDTSMDTPMAREVAGEEPSSLFAPLANLQDNERRRVLGVGIILLTLLVAILMARKLPMNRRGGWKSAPASDAYQDYFSNYALPTRESDSRESDPREAESTRPASSSPEAAPEVQQARADNTPNANTPNALASGEAPAGSDDLEQILLPLVTAMLKDMQQWREEHATTPHSSASDKANGPNTPREAEEEVEEGDSPSSGVPAYKRLLRLVDAPPDEHEEEHHHKQRTSAGGDK